MTDRNPLSGLPLESYQILIQGPGGRVTVVDTRPGAVLPHWIDRIPTATGALYRDNGQTGGTYNAQELPTIEVTAPAPLLAGGGPMMWLGLVFLLGALATDPALWRRLTGR